MPKRRNNSHLPNPHPIPHTVSQSFQVGLLLLSFSMIVSFLKLYPMFEASGGGDVQVSLNFNCVVKNPEFSRRVSHTFATTMGQLNL